MGSESDTALSYYHRLTPEQRDARRVKQTEAQRIRRAAIKAGTHTVSKFADASDRLEKRRAYDRERMRRIRAAKKASGILQERPQAIPAPMNRPHLKNASSAKR